MDSVEALMAFEESLGEEVPRRFPELKPFLREPREARCSVGGFSSEVAVFAEDRAMCIFISLDAQRFGVGSMVGREVQATAHFPMLAMAVRAFNAATKERA